MSSDWSNIFWKSKRSIVPGQHVTKYEVIPLDDWSDTDTAQTCSPLTVSTNSDQLSLWTTDRDGCLHLNLFMSRAFSRMQGAPSLPPSSSTAGALLLASYILFLFIRTVFRRRLSQETCQNNLTEPGHGLPDHIHCDHPSYTRHSLVELGTSQKLKRTSLRNPVLDHLPSMCLLYKTCVLVATPVTDSKTWPFCCCSKI